VRAFFAKYGIETQTLERQTLYQVKAERSGRHSSAHPGDFSSPCSVLRNFVTAPTVNMMSVSSASGRGLAALLLVATFAVAAFADAGDASASASDTLVNLEGSADSTDSTGSADMDLFRGRALLQAGTHTPPPPTSTRAAAADTQITP
jgi:hypothetical protein